MLCKIITVFRVRLSFDQLATHVRLKKIVLRILTAHESFENQLEFFTSRI